MLCILHVTIIIYNVNMWLCVWMGSTNTGYVKNYQISNMAHTLHACTHTHTCMHAHVLFALIHPHNPPPTHTCTHAHTCTHTHTCTHIVRSYMRCMVLWFVLSMTPLSSWGYPMIICTHPVAGNWPIKTLVARQWQTHTHTHRAIMPQKTRKWTQEEVQAWSVADVKMWLRSVSDFRPTPFPCLSC